MEDEKKIVALDDDELVKVSGGIEDTYIQLDRNIIGNEPYLLQLDPNNKELVSNLLGC